MKLLFDQNLSPKLVNRLADLFPDSVHVSILGLDTATDREVWEYAKRMAFTLVSKDADFSDLSLLYEFPPKVIWIRRGNCPTKEIETILRDHYEDIMHWHSENNSGVVLLY